MYVHTFYSFKGGVGRTLALANVAVHLARRGRRVLVVDFDLEAPGLDTFPPLRPEEPVPGLVDYVVEYLKTDQAPDIRGFVGQSPAVDNLLVMPSGAMAYALTLDNVLERLVFRDANGSYSETRTARIPRRERLVFRDGSYSETRSRSKTH